MNSFHPGSSGILKSRGPFSQTNRKRKIADILAKRVVTVGGWTIIAAILAIMFVIVGEFLPLFKTPETKLLGQFKSSSTLPVLATGLDEYQEVAYLIDASGIHFVSLKDYKSLPDIILPELAGATITSVSSSNKGFPVLGLSDGRVLSVHIQFQVSYAKDKRNIQPKLVATNEFLFRPDASPIKIVGHIKTENGLRVAVVKDSGIIAIKQVEERKTLMGTVKKKITELEVMVPAKGEISALAFDEIRDGLVVGTTSGQIFWIANSSSSEQNKPHIIGATINSKVKVSFLKFLLGSYTLMVGDSNGGIVSLQFFREADGSFRLQKINEFKSHDAPVRLISTSLRDKGFITGVDGEIHVHYGTTGTTKVSLRQDTLKGLTALALSQKGNAILAADARGNLVHWELNNPYPQVSLKSLFSEIWYEDYEKPEYVWQSTGGSDEFESKFSLMPLIFGTLKGTFYAMLFAVPLAILAAFYTSQFMHPRVKSVVKPTVEIMAALPSVVLGFFGALFIAPLVEKFLPGVLLMPFIIAAVVFAVVVVFLGSKKIGGWIRPGREIYWLIPVTLIGFFLAFEIGKVVESAFLMGDHRAWLREMFQVTYDQRNALVVGLAMGFAIIPIIFTITEDAMSNVPEHLKASSLALGATPWQTALWVILPTASPGLFSAVMIGLGRAVGETMIVLMATGNTPVMDWDMFNGFRAMSANIAVELPEAPEGGTQFRILFLSAFLLFMMTFMVNTLAEVVRLRLRKKYRTL
jgi:phosphate transport system permease protein